MKNDRFIHLVTPLARAGIAGGFVMMSLLGNGLAGTEKDADGFRLATPGYAFRFPRDHGSHPDFRLEWWYLSGHLKAVQGRERFGFQATFFRVGLRPVDPVKPLEASHPRFGTTQIYLAHMAILNARSRKFVFEERINRDGWDAFSRVEDLEVRNGNWSLKRVAGDHGRETIALEGTVRSQAAFGLRLQAQKPLVIFGKDGVSRKGAEPGAASLYLTFPRLQAEGEVNWRGQSYTVTGQAWMDHEISSSQLGQNQVGWNWASIQLNDGREIMVYLMRNRDGSADPHSTLSWVDRTGQVTRLGKDSFRWSPTRTWTSPATQAAYPIGARLRTRDPQRNKVVTFELRPLADGQEIRGRIGGVSYWEGACDVLDEAGGMIGQAYLELTGYDHRLGSMLRGIQGAR